MAAGFTYTPSGETQKTHVLQRPLDVRVVPARRTNRWERTSLDLSVREVISVGSGREEVEVTIGSERNPTDLLHLLTQGANGLTINYKPYLDGSMSFPLHVIGEPTELGPDPRGGGLYTVRARFRDASASGSGLEAMYSPWWYKYSGGMKRGGDMTHTRATTAFQDSNLGVLTSVASGGLRDGHWVENENGLLVPSTLLEGSRVNQFTQPEDLTHADWSVAGLSARNANQAGDPKGGTALDELVEGSSLNSQGVQQNKTLTADVNYALSAWAKKNTRTWLPLRLFETAASGNSVSAWFDLATGAVGSNLAAGTGTFTRAYIEDWTDVVPDLYRCVLVGKVGNAATGISARVGVSNADGTLTYTGDGSSSLYAGFAMLEDNANFASSYHDGTRNADALSDTINFTPADIVAAGGATFYSEWIERGTAFGGTNAALWRIANSTPYLSVQGTGTEGAIKVQYDDGGGAQQAVVGGGNIAIASHVRLRLTIEKPASTWEATPHWSIGGAAEVSGSAIDMGADLPDDWGSADLSINAAPAGLNIGFAAHIAHLFMPGVVSLAECTRRARA